MTIDEREVADRVYEFLDGYLEKFGEAPNLGLLGRRFNREVRSRCGMRLEELLRLDARFVLNMIKSGATLVTCVPPEFSTSGQKFNGP
jgi:hypothetical protein